MDSWIHGCCVQQIASVVFASMPRARAESRTVAAGMLDQALVTDITGALIIQVLLQYLDLWEHLCAIHVLSGVPDSVIRRWSSDHKYSAASAYGAMFIGSTSPFSTNLIWETHAPPKVRFFFWLALHRRCWTVNRRMRHGLQDSNSCVMCLQLPCLGPPSFPARVDGRVHPWRCQSVHLVVLGPTQGAQLQQEGFQLACHAYLLVALEGAQCTDLPR